MFRDVPGRELYTYLAVQEASEFNRFWDAIPAKSTKSIKFGKGSAWNFVLCGAVRRMRTATLKANDKFTSACQG